MTVFVPYDGSALSRTALRRATTLAPQFDGAVSVVTIVPAGNTEYARKKGWIAPGESFDAEAIEETLAAQVAEIAPDATFRAVRVGRSAQTGTVSTRLRREAAADGATLVVVGSEEAGGVLRSLISVGAGVTADRRYDVYLVRHADDDHQQG